MAATLSSPVRRPVSSPQPNRSPAQLARSTGANVTNQAILQSRLNKIDAEFREIHSILHESGSREHASPPPRQRSARSSPRASPSRSSMSRTMSATHGSVADLQATSTQRHRERLARAADGPVAVPGSTFGAGRSGRGGARSLSPPSSSLRSPGRVRVADFASPVRSSSTERRAGGGQQQDIYSPGAQAKLAAASAITSPLRQSAYDAGYSTKATDALYGPSSSATHSYNPPPSRSPPRNNNSSNTISEPYYPSTSGAFDFGQTAATAFHSLSTSLGPIPPPLPSSVLSNSQHAHQPSSSLSGSAGEKTSASPSSSTPYVLSGAFPSSFTSLLSLRDHRLDSYLADHISGCQSRLDKLKRSIHALQRNADAFFAAHDAELTGLKRDALVEEVNHEIALLERRFRQERAEAEERLSAFLENDKAERVSAFRSILQSEGEEAIERLRKDYLLRRASEADALRASIARDRDLELSRLRSEMQRESTRVLDDLSTTLRRDSQLALEEERIRLANAQAERVAHTRDELARAHEEELRLLRDAFARSTSEQLDAEEHRARQRREGEFAALKDEIRSRLSARSAEAQAAAELHHERIMHEWETEQTASYEREAALISERQERRLAELQAKAQAEFQEHKTLKLQALEHRLQEEMKENLARQMATLKNDFLAAREGLTKQLEQELREKHAFELDQYRQSLMDERAAELEQLTGALKAQSDQELVEVTHELAAEKSAALQALRDQFESEREKWLVKLQAAYEVDKQLAEDRLIKQYESEKAVSLTDLRVTLANRKAQALDEMSHRMEAEKASKIRGINATLASLAVTPSNDADLARIQAAVQGRHSEVDKFTSLAKKIQKLQEENAALKGATGKGCRTCDALLAASQDGALSKQAQARQQLALHRQQHH